MFTETVKGTEVAYHSEYSGDARPAIRVKVYDFDRETFDRLTRSMGEARAEQLFEYAQYAVASAWWDEAAAMADALGLGGIEQEGRSGGWLVFTDGRDPLDMGGKVRRDWLAAYREMAEWCRTSLEQIPAEIAQAAVDMANAEAVAP